MVKSSHLSILINFFQESTHTKSSHFPQEMKVNSDIKNDPILKLTSCGTYEMMMICCITHICITHRHHFTKSSTGNEGVLNCHTGVLQW